MTSHSIAGYRLTTVRRLQCTTKELDSFLSPDCHHIYDVAQAEMFQNKCGRGT